MLIITLGAFAYYYKTHSLTSKVSVKTGDFVMKNANKGKIKIITGDVSEIKINLKGDPEELKNVNFGKLDNKISEFSLPANSKGIIGTITVPRSIKLVDLDKPLVNKSQIPNTKSTTPSEGSGGQGDTKTTSGSSSTSSTKDTTTSKSTDTKKDDSNSQNTTDDDQQNQTTPPVNTPTPLCRNGIIETGEQCDDGNMVSGDGCSATCQIEATPTGCGNGITEGTEQCDDGNTANGDGCSAVCTTEGAQYLQCTILIKQEERNTCCQQLYANSSHESCTGYWIFDYNIRQCKWHCPIKDCGSETSQSKQNTCCKTEKANETTPPCSGDWAYNNTDQICEYKCVDFDGNEEDVSDEETTSVSSYCTNTYTDKNKQSQCCDDFLKHPLSIGFSPNSPDCLGKWSIPKGGNKCTFKCATYEERLEILKKLNE